MTKQIKVVYEDDNLLVVNKPSGVIVNKAATTIDKETVQDWLVKKKIGLDVDRNGIVHRLDKDTSGLLIIAKDQKSMDKIQLQFKERRVNKEYLALVHGHVTPSSGKISAPITRNPFNRQRFGVFVGGKEAVTEYKVKQRFIKDKDRYSLVGLKPVTGRTHQLRIHLKHLNYPIVADDWYAGRKTALRDKVWCPRLFLEASSIEFKQPQTLKQIKLEVTMSSDLQSVLNKLKKA